MLERTETRFGIKPASLTADSAYGSADSLAWLVKEKDIAPHIPVFDTRCGERVKSALSVPSLAAP